MIKVFVATEYHDMLGTHHVGDEVSFPGEGASAVATLVERGILSRTQPVQPVVLPDVAPEPTQEVKEPVRPTRARGTRTRRT